MNPNDTTDSTEDGIETDSRPDEGASLGRHARWLLLFGTPILLGALFFVHPDGSGGLSDLLPISDSWLALHVLMLPLLGLLGVSFYVLLEGYTGPVATAGRIGVAVYGTFYVAFEAIAGVTTGLLAHEAHAHAADQQAGLAAAVDAVAVPSAALGFVGAVGALVAVAAIGLLYRRSGAPLVPVILLGGAPLATVFHGGTPLDAVGIGLFVAGLAWLELGWRRTAAQSSPRAA